MKVRQRQLESPTIILGSSSISPELPLHHAYVQKPVLSSDPSPFRHAPATQEMWEALAGLADCRYFPGLTFFGGDVYCHRGNHCPLLGAIFK
jgi:hypothetical protein